MCLQTPGLDKVQIRLADKDDAELIADISRQAFFDTYAAFNTKENMDKYMNEQLTRESMIERVRDEKSIFYIAHAGDEIAGYMQLDENSYPDTLKDISALEVVRFYAVKKMIGLGIGSALMKCCIDHARSKNKEIIWLIVWKQNARAIDFYSKWGFEIFGVHDFVLGDDVQEDWLMKLDVGE